MNQKKNAEHVGRRFRNFRVGQGLRQKDISAILGVSHSNISRLERGYTRRLDSGFLGRCRSELGLSIDWLLTGQGLMIPTESGITTSTTESSRQQGKRKRSGRVSLSSAPKELQQKRNELSTALARVTHLVQELFVSATDQVVQVKKK